MKDFYYSFIHSSVWQVFTDCIFFIGHYACPGTDNIMVNKTAFWGGDSLPRNMKRAKFLQLSKVLWRRVLAGQSSGRLGQVCIGKVAETRIWRTRASAEEQLAQTPRQKKSLIWSRNPWWDQLWVTRRADTFHLPSGDAIGKKRLIGVSRLLV